jgi:hypothetical protein
MARQETSVLDVDKRELFLIDQSTDRIGFVARWNDGNERFKSTQCALLWRKTSMQVKSLRQASSLLRPDSPGARNLISCLASSEEPD